MKRAEFLTTAGAALAFAGCGLVGPPRGRRTA